MTVGPIINVELCTGCKRCYEFCPIDVFGFDKANKIAVSLYPDECWYCGVCELECPEQCIDVRLPAQVRIRHTVEAVQQSPP